jgi:uncharacterized protein YecE (DUF72 family)
MKRQTRIGISGWTYDRWRGTFYPEDLPHKKELSYASREVNSIEINGSFYSMQTPKSYRKWYDETPKNFVFSVKANRYITHIKQLKNVDGAVARFLASGLLELKEKLGPILWQLPPRMKYNPEKMETFLKLLPHDFSEAAKLIRKNGESYRVSKNRKLQHVIEVRNISFANKEFYLLLKKYDVALVVSDAGGEWPHLEEVTSDLMYCRLHGAGKLYESGYDNRLLNQWAKKLKDWRDKKKCDVYVYFDNDVKVRAPFDAISLLKKLTDFKPAEERPFPDLKKIPTLKEDFAQAPTRWRYERRSN